MAPGASPPIPSDSLQVCAHIMAPLKDKHTPLKPLNISKANYWLLIPQKHCFVPGSETVSHSEHLTHSRLYTPQGACWGFLFGSLETVICDTNPCALWVESKNTFFLMIASAFQGNVTVYNFNPLSCHQLPLMWSQSSHPVSGTQSHS